MDHLNVHPGLGQDRVEAGLPGAESAPGPKSWARSPSPPPSVFLVFFSCPLPAPPSLCFPFSILSSTPVPVVLGYIFLIGNEREKWLVKEWTTEARQGGKLRGP